LLLFRAVGSEANLGNVNRDSVVTFI